MADSSNPTSSPTSTQLPVSIILVIAIGAYMLVIVALLLLRQFLVARGSCGECAPCGKEDGSFQCCDCWVSLAEACNCCAYPNRRSCLDSLCGPPSNCGGCDFACKAPECECAEIDCCCFKMQFSTS
ncbi:keratin-associated protein 5-2-like isoform X2 [Anneissia japonica]|uniref:keratin-associated protein 5-2-like isoform X2 n=1 Tax=Anneissia japonica TaxID=1529436 RepID=UPI0014259DC3|nr:keratin-associated protein 5-2-like isoform X2 [Anneissia japonica]